MTKQQTQELIKRAGGPTIVGRWCGTTKQNVSGWVRVPEGHVLTIERNTNFELSRHEMRLDLYPQDEFCRCPFCKNKQVVGLKKNKNSAA